MTSLATPIRDQRPHSTHQGFLAAIAAYVIWGSSPLFFHALDALAPFEVVAHRIVWSTLAIGLFIVWNGRLPDVLTILSHPRKASAFAASALSITLNWGLYIWAVTHGHGVEASVGYYIFPLLSAVFATVLLKESLGRRQGLALLIILAGVSVMVIGLGTIPWISLSLALTFTLYGLIRKTVPADSLVGLFIETLVMLPFALGFLLYQHLTGQGLTHLHHTTTLWMMLIIGTPLWTGLPLFLFAVGARRLRFSTIGVMQYINPTGQFLIATLVFHEAFTRMHAITFGLIWLGVAVYSWPCHPQETRQDEDSAHEQT